MRRHDPTWLVRTALIAALWTVLLVVNVQARDDTSVAAATARSVGSTAEDAASPAERTEPTAENTEPTAKNSESTAESSESSAELEAQKTDYEAEILAWRQRRLERLTADTGYLTLAGLFWLEEGENSFGSDPTNTCVFPAHSAPPQAGVIEHRGKETWLRSAPETPTLHDGAPIQEIRLVADADGPPTVIELGDLSFYLIRRGDRYAIRMRDERSEIRKNFHGIESYPIDTAYRVQARLEPYEPPKQVPIVNVVGHVDTMPSPGALVFTLHGQECRLDPLWSGPDDDSLWLVFRDATSGDETYGDGRFLYTDLPVNGQVVIDFNKAYNPPCAFSPFTTCPLPPWQNELSVPVRAGEKKYDDHEAP
jgi:uncharacterized protein (DUF1684 family)